MAVVIERRCDICKRVTNGLMLYRLVTYLPNVSTKMQNSDKGNMLTEPKSYELCKRCFNKVARALE